MFSLNKDIFPWNEYNSVNEYNCLEWLYFLWINICPLNQFISLTVNKHIISLKLNKYNSLKLLKYTVAGCKIMLLVQIYFVECEYMYFLIFALFTKGQPKSTLSGQANKYRLWFIGSLHTLRAETSYIPRKAETSCIPTKNVYVSPRQIHHYHWNLLFH